MVAAFELYQGCRTVQVVHLEVAERDQSKHLLLNMPVSYHHYPEDGGLLDQPCWTMAMFGHFQNGEMAAAKEHLK